MPAARGHALAYPHNMTPTAAAARPAVIFDRDDTLVRCTDLVPSVGGDLGDPGRVELMPGARETCRRLKAAGFVLGVASNQGGVARGRYGLEQVGAVNDRVNELLGGSIEAFRVCPYHPLGVVCEYAREHPWRKPAPGMLLDLASTLNLDLARSWMVGDAERDIEAGRAAGCRTILVPRDGVAPGTTIADYVAPTLAGAADIILRERITPP